MKNRKPILKYEYGITEWKQMEQEDWWELFYICLSEIKSKGKNL